MSIVAGIAEELHVFQEMTWTNVDTLIDEFINQYGFAPQEIRVSEVGQRKLEADLPRLGLEPALLSKLSRYRGVTVKTQETFSHDTIELVAFDKMSKESEEYIDQQTGMRLTVEYDNPEWPRVTAYWTEDKSFSTEELNEAIRRLLHRAGCLKEEDK